MFVQSLPFDHALYDVKVISRFDPLQPVMVLHRILDNLLSAIGETRLEGIVRYDGVVEALVEIKDGWAATYSDLFQPYLRAVNEFAPGVSRGRSMRFATARFRTTGTSWARLRAGIPPGSGYWSSA